MTKLIVEMEMPPACRWYEDGKTKRCPIAEWGGACAVTKLFEPFDDKRPSWCPIKGVLPDEHGDLIDRDALFLKYKEQYDFIDEEDILNAEAVIAAEGEDDE